MSQAEVEKVQNKCKYCSKVFSVTSNLNRHVRRVHEKPNCAVEKNVTCTKCQLSFRDNYQLRVHSRTHSREKPYSCSLCSFTAGRKGDVVRHMKRCSGPKYQCNNCQIFLRELDKKYMSGKILEFSVKPLGTTLKLNETTDISNELSEEMSDIGNTEVKRKS